MLHFSKSKKLLLTGGGDGAAMVHCVVNQEGGEALGSAGNVDLGDLSPFFVNVSMHSSELPEHTVSEQH